MLARPGQRNINSLGDSLRRHLAHWAAAVEATRLALADSWLRVAAIVASLTAPVRQSRALLRAAPASVTSQGSGGTCQAVLLLEMVVQSAVVLERFITNMTETVLEFLCRLPSSCLADRHVFLQSLNSLAHLPAGRTHEAHQLRSGRGRSGRLLLLELLIVVVVITLLALPDLGDIVLLLLLLLFLHVLSLDHLQPQKTSLKFPRTNKHKVLTFPGG